jgi:hypothetical protein
MNISLSAGAKCASPLMVFEKNLLMEKCRAGGNTLIGD